LTAICKTKNSGHQAHTPSNYHGAFILQHLWQKNKNIADFKSDRLLAANAQELIDWAMSLLETCEKLEEENCLLRGQVEDLSKTE
jgi:hypothetical protein